MPVVRLLAVAAGLLILACATWAVIASARLTGADAALVASLAIGTAVGAFVIARSHWLAGVAIAITVFCGEGYGMLTTAERIVAMRETAQAPAREAAQRQATAAARVKAAETAFAAAPTTSSRIAAALAAKSEAEKVAVAKSAERNCADNCRKVLEVAVTSAQTELTDAWRQINEQRDRLQAALDTERAALASLHLPAATGTALADRLHVPPWLLDLTAACLLTIGANGLAAVLIAWAAHGARKEAPASHAEPPRAGGDVGGVIDQPLPSPPVLTPAAELARLVAPLPAAPPQPGSAVAGEPTDAGNVTALPVGSLTRFLLDAVVPTVGARLGVADLFAAYRRWCQAGGLAPVGVEQFTTQLAQVCAKAGIATQRTGGRMYVVDVGLAAPSAAMPTAARN